MREQPMTLGVRMRPIVAAAITEVCTNRGWSLLASNVRTNHVHVVVAGPDNPVAAMTAFKAWSTRRLREEGLIPNRDRVWTRHGSTRFLYTVRAVAAAVAYVVEGQGDDLGGTVPPQSELL